MFKKFMLIVLLTAVAMPNIMLSAADDKQAQGENKKKKGESYIELWLVLVGATMGSVLFNDLLPKNGEIQIGLGALMIVASTEFSTETWRGRLGTWFGRIVGGIFTGFGVFKRYALYKYLPSPPQSF